MLRYILCLSVPIVVAAPRGSNNNGYTPASLANITSQPKEELDGNGTSFYLVNANTIILKNFKYILTT